MSMLLVGFQPKRAMTYPHLEQVAGHLFSRGADYCLFRERGYFLGETSAWRRLPWSVASIAYSSAAMCVDLARLILRRMRHRYDLVVAVDNVAYMTASRLFPRVVLWSHDFLTDDEPRSRSRIQRFIKKQVAHALRRHGGLIIQDNERFELFCDTYLGESGSGVVNAFLLPVSLLSAGSPISRPCGTPPVLMQIGGINAARSRSDELLDDFQRNHRAYSLMFHGYIDAEMADRIERATIVPKVSSSPVSPGDVHVIVERSDIGFIAYGQVNKNFFHVARASGQLAEYLRCGKPVIVLGDSSLGLMLAQEGAGVAIRDIGELMPALRRIQADYGNYASNCRRLFAATYDLSRYLPALSAWLVKRSRR